MNIIRGRISGVEGGVSGVEFRQIRVSASNHTLMTTDYVHDEIHAGNHYYIEGFVTLGAAASLYVKLVTPDSAVWSHFQWSISSSGILETYLDEGATGGMTGGSGVVPINSNRNSINTSDIVITSGVTVATGYDLRVSQAKWGATGFKVTMGGGDSRDDEIILKQNTTYLRTFTSPGADNIVQFKASWYEHESRD